MLEVEVTFKSLAETRVAVEWYGLCTNQLFVDSGKGAYLRKEHPLYEKFKYRYDKLIIEIVFVKDG